MTLMFTILRRYLEPRRYIAFLQPFENPQQPAMNQLQAPQPNQQPALPPHQPVRRSIRTRRQPNRLSL